MLVKLIPADDREHFLELSCLFSFADKPIFWDGKNYEDITSSTDLSKLSIQEGEQERELIEELHINCGLYDEIDYNSRRIREKMINKLKEQPITKVQDPKIRAQAANSVLHELLEEKGEYNSISTPKTILFQLILIALKDGKISAVERDLLREYQTRHNLEDFIFDDLLERAEAINQEISKTIAIIME